MTSSNEPNHKANARPRLRLAVPDLSMSRLPSPSSSLKKEKREVPSSGRGGLGNVRAAKSQQFEAEISALRSPISTASLFSAIPSEPGSSGASLYSASTTGVDIDRRISAGSTRFGCSWNRRTGCLVSGDVSDSMNNHRAEEISSHLGSPTSLTFSRSGSRRESMFSTNSTNTFGIPRVPASRISTKSKSASLERRSVASSEHAKHFASDSSVRTNGKHLHAINDELRVQASTPRHVTRRVRTGRGGAGVYTKANKDIDASLFPTTAALTREHELRLAAQESLLLAESRARAAAARRTGRGGVGNFSAPVAKRTLEGRDELVDVKLAPKLLKRLAKVKGKSKITRAGGNDNDEELVKHEGTVPHRGHRRSASATSLAGSVYSRRSLRLKSTVHVQRGGLSRLWSSVTNVRSTRHRTKSGASIKFEIVELKPDNRILDRAFEASEEPGPESTEMSCDASSYVSTSVNTTISLTSIESRTQRIRLAEVREEETWIDESQPNSVTERGIIADYQVEPLDMEPVHRTSTGNCESKSTRRSRFKLDSTPGNLPHFLVGDGYCININAEAKRSRESTGTFGSIRNNTPGDEEDVGSDSDDAESIVDPYMHS